MPQQKTKRLERKRPACNERLLHTRKSLCVSFEFILCDKPYAAKKQRRLQARTLALQSSILFIGGGLFF